MVAQHATAVPVGRQDREVPPPVRARLVPLLPRLPPLGDTRLFPPAEAIVRNVVGDKSQTPSSFQLLPIAVVEGRIAGDGRPLAFQGGHDVPPPASPRVEITPPPPVEAVEKAQP